MPTGLATVFSAPLPEGLPKKLRPLSPNLALPESCLTSFQTPFGGELVLDCARLDRRGLREGYGAAVRFPPACAFGGKTRPAPPPAAELFPRVSCIGATVAGVELQARLIVDIPGKHPNCGPVGIGPAGT